MNVFGEIEELGFGFDQDSFVSALKEGANSVIFFVDIHRIFS